MIVTFYSFRPELGCTMAAVNTGIALCKDFNQEVLLVEAKSSAATLSIWLQEHGGTPNADLHALLGEYNALLEDDQPITADRLPLTAAFANRTTIPRLSYLPVFVPRPGRRFEDFDWTDFYDRCCGGAVIEHLRNDWNRQFDFVMVVSEKGFSPAAAVSIMQLADVVVLMLSGNLNQIEISVQIAERLTSNSTSKSRGRVYLLPVPRVDLAEERFHRAFIERLAGAFTPYLPPQVDPERYFYEMQIPDVAYYRYGHEIAVLREGNDPGSISFAYKQLARYLSALRGGPVGTAPV